MNTTITTEMAQTELVTQLNLPLTEAQEIINKFSPIAISISEIDSELAVLAQKDLDVEVCEKAKAIRLKYVKLRTEGDRIHKGIKESVLLRSKAIDSARNIFKHHIQEREAQLEKIEKHFENLEAKKRQELAEKRSTLLHELNVINTEYLNLGEMADEVWEGFYESQKLKFQAEQEAAKKAYEERLELERVAKLHSQRHQEILHLYQFVEDKSVNLGMMTEMVFNTFKAGLEKAKSDYELEQQKIKEENEKLKKEAEEKAKALEKERAKKEAELQKEREKQAKLEAELEAKKQKEIADQKEAEERQRAKEKAQKNEAFINFLGANGATMEDVKLGLFKVEQDKGVFTLYKKIDQITIS